MLSSHHRFARLVAFLTVLGCSSAVADRASHDATSSAAAAALNNRQCNIPMLASLPPEAAAVQCAEWFVARNGYTDLPAIEDSALLAGEPLETARTAAELLAGRRNTLARRAAVLCTGSPRGSGYTVAFLSPADRSGNEGRAVTMNLAYASLRIEHQAFLPREALRDTRACRSLPGLSAGTRNGAPA